MDINFRISLRPFRSLTIENCKYCKENEILLLNLKCTKILITDYDYNPNLILFTNSNLILTSYPNLTLVDNSSSKCNYAFSFLHIYIRFN